MKYYDFETVKNNVEKINENFRDKGIMCRWEVFQSHEIEKPMKNPFTKVELWAVIDHLRVRAIKAKGNQ